MNLNSRDPLPATALDPDRIKIDGRTYQDRLAFLANFARLILFYDQKNQQNGDWSPFLLKDPILLLAAISKADYSGYHERFLQLQQYRSSLKDQYSDIDFANQLCAILQNMFTEIDRWSHYMQLDANAYTLRDFLDMAISKTLTTPFGLLITIQRYLSIKTNGRVHSPHTFYNNFLPIWKTWAQSAMPDLSDKSISETLDLLVGVYFTLLDVYVQTVDNAHQAFVQKSLLTDYPDTALLIAFSQLMDIQQEQINAYSRKHLDFYYEKVLQQRLRPAQPDQVYVCLNLAETISDLHLPAQTHFKAGVYPDGSDVLFLNETAADLNQAAIAQAYTLYYGSKNENDPKTLYLNKIPHPTQLSRNSLQETLSWDAFGNTAGHSMQLGFALASPMLFLQGGTRKITIRLEFKNNSTQADLTKLFNGCQYYLSTDQAWVQVKGGITQTPENLTTVSIELNLLASEPAIVSFSKNPDGLTSQWPMFKVLFGPSADLCQPPSLHSVGIDVDVQELTQLSIANDLSPLPTSGPGLLFGPIPQLGSCFYIGSNECFSKPMNALSVTINWSNLPAEDFSDYYAAYNEYLPELKNQPFNNSAFTGQWKLLSHKNLPNPAASLTETHVTTQFSLFQNIQPNSKPNAKSTFNFIQSSMKSTSKPDPELMLTPLPTIGQAKNGYIYFELMAPHYAFGHSVYAKVVMDVTMKNAEVLVPNAKGSSQLQSPTNTLSAAVDVAIVVEKAAQDTNDVAQKAESEAKRATKSFNAILFSSILRVFRFFWIASKPTEVVKTTESTKIAEATQPTEADKPVPLPMPNPPYSPQLSRVSITYHATATTVISSDSIASNYPFELYHYGIFRPYLAYDAQDASKGYGFSHLTPQPPPKAQTTSS